MKNKFIIFLANVLWFILGGFVAGIVYIIGGIVLCLTLIGIPFGLQAMKIGFAVFFPFGKEFVETESARGCLMILFNVLWIVLVGWGLVLGHLAAAGGLVLTIVGIPFAIKHIKLIPLALTPFGRKVEKVV